MGLDSVELVMAFEEAFGLEIPEADAAPLGTPAAVIAYIYSRVRDDRPEDQGALSPRAMYRLRRAFCTVVAPKQSIRMGTKISTLLSWRSRREQQERVRLAAGLTLAPRVPLLMPLLSPTFRNLVETAVVTDHSRLRLPRHGWSKQQVREVVRILIRAQLNLTRFSDSDRFVEGLGLD